nr:phosphotransferase [Ferrovum sp.]
MPFEAIRPASSDASFRRYFRVMTPEGSRILMDAPPDKEDCHSFVRVSRLFAEAGVHVPRILAWEEKLGFMMLEDFGETSYLSALQTGEGRGRGADTLYGNALGALVQIQRASRDGVLPLYDRTLLQREIDLFPEWYVQKHLGIVWTTQERATFGAVVQGLLEAIDGQARVWVHRDYHTRNLMVASPDPGVLDFQDAVQGPVTYDAVSLLKDAYIDWEETRVLDWLVRYWEQARAAGIPVGEDFGAFYQDFEWMGVQRHLKVLGIFARLAQRDGKTGYLADMPRVEKYLMMACRRYKALQPLVPILERLWQIPSRTGYTF